MHNCFEHRSFSGFGHNFYVPIHKGSTAATHWAVYLVLMYVVPRAGRLGFAVLQCSSKSYFQAIFKEKRIHVGARSAPSQIHLKEHAKNESFNFIEI